MRSVSEEQLTNAREIINNFMTGKDIDWSQVETVFLMTEYLIDYIER